jgi:hypothetical protein
VPLVLHFLLRRFFWGYCLIFLTPSFTLAENIILCEFYNGRFIKVEMSLPTPPALVSYSISLPIIIPTTDPCPVQSTSKRTSSKKRKENDNRTQPCSPVVTTSFLQPVPFHTPEELTEYERDQIKHLVEDVLPLEPSDTVRSVKYLKLIHRNVFSLQYRDELASIGRRTLLRRILYACVVRQVIINYGTPLPTVDQLQKMPFYEDKNLIPPSELETESLRHFMRAIQAMHEMGMPAASNKKTYIEVAAMLDDSKCTYALGGAPSKATMRRVMIYHRVTGIESPSYMQKASSKRRKINDIVEEDSSESQEGEFHAFDVADCIDDELAVFASV